jgi:hypothetical protein
VVVQERLLSPRIVHFCTGQVFWECAELGACESFLFPAGLPDRLGGSEVNKFNGLLSVPPNSNPEMGSGKSTFLGTGWFHRLLPSLLPQPQSPPSSSTACELWALIVNEYSRCSLAKGSDKLITISGVAKTLQPALDDSFVAGSWRKRLAHGLA